MKKKWRELFKAMSAVLKDSQELSPKEREKLAKKVVKKATELHSNAVLAEFMDVMGSIGPCETVKVEMVQKEYAVNVKGRERPILIAACSQEQAEQFARKDGHIVQGG